MKRKDFLKLMGLSAAGALINPFSDTVRAASDSSKKSILTQELIMPEEATAKIVIKKDDQWVGWLARLAVSSLVTALGARIVEHYTGDCICDGTTCYKSPPNYSNAVGLYGTGRYDTRFVRQAVNDYNVEFTNVSVPFLSHSNGYIGNVEGPFLAGLCWAISDLSKQYYTENVKKVLIPIGGLRNGGYRFDTDACHSTEYKTKYGSAKIVNQSGYNGGEVTVQARDGYNNLDFSKTFDYSYA